MPNHFHLAAWPRGDGDLSRWMHWLLTTHVRRYRRHYRSSGQIWQGRFQAFPIQEDDHLRAVLRSIERNPLRAALVARAEHWPRSSLSRPSPALDVGPAPRGEGWIDAVNAVMTEGGCAAIRDSIRRGRPLGGDGWILRTAAALGLESSLRDRGRPRQAGEEDVPG
jgi:putative transposase